LNCLLSIFSYGYFFFVAHNHCCRFRVFVGCPNHCRKEICCSLSIQGSWVCNWFIHRH